jgi:hypothetical protein
MEWGTIPQGIIQKKEFSVLYRENQVFSQTSKILFPKIINLLTGKESI